MLRLLLPAGSSKIKIRTSSHHKANCALWRDEIRILIFDDPAELEESQRPPREGKLSNPRGTRRTGCMHGENLRNPARASRAGAMRWLPTGQVYSSMIYQPNSVLQGRLKNTY